MLEADTAIAEQSNGSATSAERDYLRIPEMWTPTLNSAFITPIGSQPKPANTTAVDTPDPVEMPVAMPVRPIESESASLIQIWEGTVQDVRPKEGSMRVLLRSKLTEFPDHFADIELEWVPPQDRDLVRPGAVFYLSLYRGRRRGGTIINAQELRFRRLPSWNKRDVILVRESAKRLLAKGITKPEAP